MIKTKKVIIVIAVVVFLIIGTIKVIFINDKKGGSDALTIFDVNSTGIELSNENDKTLLIGEDRKKLIHTIKGVIKNAPEVKLDKVIYDIKIDFKNSYIAYVSTKDKILLFQNVQRKIDEKILNNINKYLSELG